SLLLNCLTSAFNRSVYCTTPIASSAGNVVSPSHLLHSKNYLRLVCPQQMSFPGVATRTGTFMVNTGPGRQAWQQI
ncbi:MAG: hypothetical protein ACSLE0_00010, partial [Chitinophagaceae bacterium]